MNDLKSDEAVAGLITDFTKLKEIYEGELAEVSNQISNNTGDLVLTADVLDNLAAEVQRIRGQIIM